MTLGCPGCGSLKTDHHADACEHPMALKVNIRRKLETHIALKESSPGFHLSDAELSFILTKMKPEVLDPRSAALAKTLGFMIETLRQSRDCVRGETPEDMTFGEAEDDTISKIREAMERGEEAIRALQSAPAGEPVASDRLLALLRQHHDWHLQSGPIGLPDGDGGWVEIDNATEYGDSRMFEETHAALAGQPAPELEPMPRGGINTWWWQVAILQRREIRALKAQIAASPQPAACPNGWKMVPVSDTIAQHVLRFLTKKSQSSVDDIKTEVRKTRPDAQDKQIYNALSYLARHGKIEQIGYGQYSITAPPSFENSASPKSGEAE